MSRSKPLPPLDVLNEWFALDSSTGVLTWKKRSNSRVQVGKAAGWTQNHNGLLRVSIQVPNYGRFLRARLVWKMHHKTEPPDVVDHMDRNSINDAVVNLRDGTNGLNNRNRKVSSRSGLMGAFPSSNNDGRWQSTIQKDGKTVYIGTYGTALEANAAYLQELEKLTQT
jgi:hypothetical protein